MWHDGQLALPEPAPEPEPEREPVEPERQSLASLREATLDAAYAFLMAQHPRLGADSPVRAAMPAPSAPSLRLTTPAVRAQVGWLPSHLHEYILRLKQATAADNAYLLLAGGMFRPRALSGLDSCSSVLAVQLSSGRAHAEPDMKHRLSGHIAACCPAAPRPVPDAVESGEAPTVHAGGEGPEQSRPRRWAWPRDCVIAGGFADVSERSGGSTSLCHQLPLRGDPRGGWDAAPSMSTARHGGFAGAVVHCDGGAAAGAAAGAGAAGGRENPDGAVLAVAGGRAARSGAAALSSGEWLCRERGTWYDLGSSMSTARYGCAGAALGSRLLVMGGSDDSRRTLASVEAIDLREGKWRALGPLPQPLYGAAACNLVLGPDAEGEPSVLLCGGFNGERAVAATYLYDAAADRWRRPVASAAAAGGQDGRGGGGACAMGAARLCHAVAAVPRRCLPPSLLATGCSEAAAECLVALGGKPSVNDAEEILGSVEVLDPQSWTWRPMHWQLQEPCWHMTAATVLL